MFNKAGVLWHLVWQRFFAISVLLEFWEGNCYRINWSYANQSTVNVRIFAFIFKDNFGWILNKQVMQKSQIHKRINEVHRLTWVIDPF